MNYQSIAALTFFTLLHNCSYAMLNTNQTSYQNPPIFPHFHLEPVYNYNRLQPLPPTSADLAMLKKISSQINTLQQATSTQLTKLDSKICLAQRACDVLANIEHSHNNTSAETNDLLRSMIEQNKISQDEQATLENSVYNLIQQVAQQNEQQKTIAAVLATYTRPKITHEMATQTTESSFNETSISSPTYTNFSKKYKTWQKNQDKKN